MRTTYIIIGVIALLVIGGFVLAQNGVFERVGYDGDSNSDGTPTYTNTPAENNPPPSDNNNPPPPVPSGGNTTPPPPPATNQTVTVTYTSAGYSPQTVTIKKNDTVRFVNSSGKNFWPASAIHPTHEIYPAFDPKKALASGESWSFTFDQVGIWRYHDHLDASKTGTVTVTE